MELKPQIRAADEASLHSWRFLGARSRAEARAYYTSSMRRSWGCLFVREMARHRLRRVCYVGAGHRPRAAQAQGIPFWLGFSAYYSPGADWHGRGKGEDGMLRVMDNVPHTSLTDALPGLIRLATKGPDGLSSDTGCDLIGAMHTKPSDINSVLSAVQEHWDGPLLCYPDDVGADPVRKTPFGAIFTLQKRDQ